MGRPWTVEEKRIALNALVAERNRYRKALERISQYDDPGFTGIVQSIGAIATDALKGDM